MKKYSVLLLYPDRIASEYGHETFYAWVEALSTEHAIMKACIDAGLANLDFYDIQPDMWLFTTELSFEWHVLLITEGYNRGI